MISIRDSLFSKWLIIFAGLFIIWLPIPLGSNRIWSWSILEIICACFLFAHICYCLLNKRLLVTHKITFIVLSAPLLLGLYLFLQSLCLGAICSVDIYHTQQQLFKTLGFIAFIWVLSEHLSTQTNLKIFIGCLIISGCVQATYGSIINLLGIKESIVFAVNEGERARGSFVYQNHFANYLGLILCLAIGWMISELKTQYSSRSFKAIVRESLELLLSKKLILRLAIIMMIIGLILSRSRMGNTAFFVAFFAVSIFALLFYKRPPKSLRWIVLSIFVLDIIIVGSLFGLEKVKQRITDTSFASETRDEVVRDSLPIISEHFFTGTGGGSFYGVFPSYKPEMYSLYYDHAHNDYVQFAVEFGVPITILLGLYVLISLIINFQTMMKRKNKFYKGIAFGCAMAIIYMLLHISVDFNLQAPAISLTFLSIITLGWVVRFLPSKG